MLLYPFVHRECGHLVTRGLRFRVQAFPKPKSATQVPRRLDPVEKTINEAEKQYQQGQQEYSAGHLEAAKQSFDQAVNVLLEGQVDVRSDERLQSELDKISSGLERGISDKLPGCAATKDVGEVFEE